MIVHIHATGDFPDLQFLSPEWEGIRVYAIAALQEFSSLLFRDPDAIGILVCHLPDLAPQIVRGMRDGNVTSRLMVLLRERGSYERCVQLRAQTLFAGADDVQPDSIDPRELVARLRALGNRTRPAVNLIPIPPFAQFDPAGQKVIGEGVVIHLTGKECALLELLASRPGTLMSKALCMQAMYGGRDEPGRNILNVFVCQLRRKLRPVNGGQPLIETVWSQGYRFLPGEVAV